MRSATDVLFIAGGPAGLASGIAKERSSVTVADAAKPASDKARACCLALVALGKLGIGFQAGGGQVFRRMCFIDERIFAEADSWATAASASGEPFPIRGWSSGPKNSALICSGSPR